jgi:hypothetical protein
VYNPAKTVADCFKYRNKIGLDVAMEVLRDCWHNKKATSDELWRYPSCSKTCEGIIVKATQGRLRLLGSALLGMCLALD